LDERKKAFDLEDRLVTFAVNVSTVAEAVPAINALSHIPRQLIRCATSAAANYAEAQSAESRRDFVHKLKVALKELRESGVWLKFLDKKGLGDPNLVSAALGESDQLRAILYSSIATAERNAARSK
jgi:four helix bundle protein